MSHWWFVYKLKNICNSVKKCEWLNPIYNKIPIIHINYFYNIVNLKSANSYYVMMHTWCGWKTKLLKYFHEYLFKLVGLQQPEIKVRFYATSCNRNWPSDASHTEQVNYQFNLRTLPGDDFNDKLTHNMHEQLNVVFCYRKTAVNHCNFGILSHHMSLLRI